MNLRWKQHSLLRDYKSLAKSCRHALQKAITLERARDLCAWAYNLSKSPGLQEALYAGYLEQHRADRALKQLRFLARIRAAQLTIINCIRTIPTFAQLSIKTIPSSDVQSTLSGTIHQARTSAQKSLQKWSIPIPKWFKEPRLVKDLAEDYRKKPIIHAEMQMVFFLLARRSPQLSPYPYLGISKKTCYMCSAFLTQLRHFKTRGSHEKLYPHWTLPQKAELDKEKVFAFGMALSAVKQNLGEILRRPCGRFLMRQPESTNVWSSRPSVRSGPASIASSYLSSLRESLRPHGEATDAIGLWNPARLPLLMITRPNDKICTEESGLPNSPDTSQYEILEARLNALMGLLNVSILLTLILDCSLSSSFVQTHYKDLPEAVQTGLTMLEVEPSAT